MAYSKQEVDKNTWQRLIGMKALINSPKGDRQRFGRAVQTISNSKGSDALHKKVDNISFHTALTVNKAKAYQEAQKIKNASNNTNAYNNYVGSAGSAYGYANNVPSATSVNSAQGIMSGDPYTFWQQLAEKNNELNIQMNRENNQFNADQAAIQRNWEEQMSNTAHQREVSDLKAAGLNPILSAGGQGSSTPTGSSASASNWTGADNSAIHALAQVSAATLAANANITSAALSSSAMRDAAATSAQAAMYSADQSRIASMYGSDKYYAGSVYGADTAAAASRYGSDRGYTASLVNSAVYGLVGLANAMSPF